MGKGILWVEPGAAPAATYSGADLRRLAKAKGLTVTREPIDGIPVYFVENAAGQVLASSSDRLRLAYILQGKIPQGLTFKTIKAEAAKRNLLAHRQFSMQYGETLYMITDAAGNVIMGGDDLEGLWAHLQEVPAIPVR